MPEELRGLIERVETELRRTYPGETYRGSSWCFEKGTLYIGCGRDQLWASPHQLPLVQLEEAIVSLPPFLSALAAQVARRRAKVRDAVTELEAYCARSRE